MATAATCWKLGFVLILLAAPAPSLTMDICDQAPPQFVVPFNLTSPGFPALYDTGLNCTVEFEAPEGSRLRLIFDSVNFTEVDDGLMIVDQDGVPTRITGRSLPKDFIGTMFQITLETDQIDNNGTGFSLVVDEFLKDEIPVKPFMHQIDPKPGQALQLYTNDYPMLYDDNSHYFWNITSSNSNMVITVVDMDTEAQRDWIEIVAYSSEGEAEQLFHASGTEIGQISVENKDYVTIEFRSDYSRSGRGFHIIVEPNSFIPMTTNMINITGCGGNFTLGTEAFTLGLPPTTTDLYCEWRITNSVSDTRMLVGLHAFSVEDGVDYLQVSSGLDPSDLRKYRRRVTGEASHQHIYVDEGGSVTLVFSSGSVDVDRQFEVHLYSVSDRGCSGELDLTRNGRGDIPIGDIANRSHAFCQWLIKTPPQTNVNVRVNSLRLEQHYDILEIGAGSDPTDVLSRQKLFTGSVQDQTFATYSGNLWLVFTAEDLKNEDGVYISLSFDDNACRIKTVLELAGEIDSPVLPSSGTYPDDADCQWILQVRGGFQVRLHFLEFDLEYGHDQLIIGGTTPDEDDVDSQYLILTGSDIPGDVVSRYNGLNIRFKTDSSVARSGFKMTFEEFFDCPDGYEYNPINDTCYKFVTEEVSWSEARYDCGNVADGDLVVINDADENEYVWNKMLSLQAGNETEQWWIGFYDAAIYGDWSWVDCEEQGLFGQQNWQPGAPDDNDDDHCAYIDGEDSLYNDDNCNNNRSYVCEITRKNYVDSDCYPSNFRVRSSTFTQVDVAFTVSDYICDVAGYYIRHNTSIPDEYVEVYLPGALNNSVVIGGLDHGTIYHFELRTCTVTYGCYSYSTARSVLGTTESCSDGFPVAYENSCYRLSNDSVSWVDARQSCISYDDADLVNIETEGENEAMKEYLTPGYHWIGLNDVVEEGEFYWTAECLVTDYSSWNGTNHPKNEDEQCVSMDPTGLWHDNECTDLLAGYICEQKDRPFGYDPLALEPLLFDGVAVNESAIDLTWLPADQTCDIFGYTVEVYDFDTDPLKTYTVEGGDTSSLRVTGLSKGVLYTFRILTDSFSFDGMLGVRSAQAQTLGCPLGFSASPEGICYSYSEIAVTWSEARSACTATTGADLASIIDRTEFDYLSGAARVDSWIGFSDSATEGSFEWVDCSPSSVLPWSQPMENNEYRDCVMFDPVFGMFARNCTEIYGYVCEYKEGFDQNPSGFSGMPLSESEVKLSWNVSSDLCGITGYRIQYSTTTMLSEVQVEGADTNTVTVINLEQDTPYAFSIAPMLGDVVYPQSDPITVTTLVGPTCPPQYVEGPDGHCYFFSGNFHSWSEARSLCLQTRDSDLVEITSDAQTDYLTEQIGNGQYWIGLYDVTDEGDWRWGSECQEPSYLRWGEGAPAEGPTGEGEDCATVHGDTGDWEDRVCSEERLYICEVKDRAVDPDSVGPSNVSPTSPTPSSIVVEWTPSTRNCDIVSYVVGWNGQDGSTGQETVNGADSSYAIITDLTPGTNYVVFMDTVTYTFGNLGNSAGYEASTPSDCADDYVYGNGGCYKLVRSQIEYEFARDSCRQTVGGDLVVIETPNEHEYIMNMTRNMGDWWVGLYDAGTEGNFRWVDCSSLNLWQTSNWAAGQPDDSDGTQDCGQMISSGEWMDWACDRPNQYICEIHPIAVVSKDANPTDLAATGLSIVSIGLTWNPSEFNCDVIGYRIAVGQGLQVTTIEIEGGDRSAYIVNDLAIDTQYSFLIAALTMDGPLPYGDLVTARTNSEVADCPDGYEKGYLDRCYRFVKGSLTWEQARLECAKDFGGELVVVNDQFEQEYIVNRTVEGDWWIGLHDLATEGTFRWTDCSDMTPWQMSNWAPGQPDESMTNEQDCVQMITGGQWMDWPCDRPNQFVCEIFAKDYTPAQYAPSNFAGQPASDSSVVLTWTPSAFICDVEGYMIMYSDLVIDSEIRVMGGDADSVVINELRAATPYRFSIKPLLIVDRELNYAPAIEVETQPFAGCEEEYLFTSAPGNISSPYFPGNYPPNVECVYTISLDTRILLGFQLVFLVPDENDYLSISEMGEFGYEEKVRLNGVRLPKQYISMSTSIQLRFVSNNRVEGNGFLATFTEYNVEPPAEEPCIKYVTLKSGPVPLLFSNPRYPTGYDAFEPCSWVIKQSGSGAVGIAAKGNIIELVFNDVDLEEGYDVLVLGRGSNPANISTEIGRYTGTQVPPAQYVEDNVWVRLESDSSNQGLPRGFSFSATEKTPDQIPATKAPPPFINPAWNGTCGGTIMLPPGGGLTHLESPNYPSPYPENVDCLWYLESETGRFRITVDELMTETGYDVVQIGRGSDASDITTFYATLSGSVDSSFTLMVEDSSAWIRFTSDYSTSDMGFRLFTEQETDCQETLVVSPLERTISSRNYPLPYMSNEYCVWTILGTSIQPLRAVVNYFNTEYEYDKVEYGRGSGNFAASLGTRLMQMSGYVNESFTTNALTMWLAFTSDGSNEFGGFEISFFDDMCSDEELTGPSGTIRSPGFGFQYPNSAECSWVIQVEEAYNIRLTFNAFDLETGRDMVMVTRVREGGYVVLTGSDLPGELTSLGSTLLIDFVADSSGVGRGFSIDYERFFDCPEGYVEADVNGPTCYKFGTEIKTWRHARDDCRSTPGADLIVIENALENRYIRDGSGGADWWIGFYDGGTEGLFSYVECDTSTQGWAIYNWGDDQPNRQPGNDEDCVFIQGSDGYYFDDRCDLAKLYVCETLKVDVIPDAYYPTEFEAEILSPNDIRLSWTPSSYRCDVTGYTVSYAADGESGGVVVADGVNPATVDISGLTANKTYTLTLSTETFSFGTLPDTTSIMATTLAVGENNCLPGYVQGPVFTCWRFGLSPETWYDARTLCQADDPDSDLAVIDTIDELTFVNETRASNLPVWIGLNDLGNERQFRWMDCQQLSRWQSLNWVPGEPSDPLRNRDCVELSGSGQWDDIQCENTRPYVCKVQAKGFTEEDQYPTNFAAETTSALTARATWVPSPNSCNLLGYYLIASDGGINDDIVVDVVGAISVQGQFEDLIPDFLYVVSIAPYTTQGVLESRFHTTILTYNESTICPPGYEIGFDYGCYRFITDSRNWDEARADCMTTPNGDLAIVDTQEEMNYFEERGFGGLDWWIGLYDIAQEGSYRWVDCSDLDPWGQQQWDVGQPSDADGNENCAQLQDNSKFNDRDCERLLPYVCEITVKDFTYEDVDPSRFMGTSPSPSSILLTWVPSDYNCDVTGYSIAYTNDGLKMLNVPGGESSSQVITGLDADTAYTFTLRAITTMGPRNATSTTRVTTQPPENPCEKAEEGWFVGFEGRCYKVAQLLVTWDEARADCLSVTDGDLVVIETAEENQYLIDATFGNDFWIGFYDKAREGVWSWVDCRANTTFAYSNWAPGQPNDLNGDQDCGHMTQLGEFNDWECSRTNMYICEVSRKGYLPIQANPALFRGEAVNPNTVSLTWIPSMQFSCDVVAYRISYVEPGSVDPTFVDVLGAESSSVTINDLQDGTAYNFSIAAVLAAGPVQVTAQNAIVETPSLNELCEPGWEPGFNYQCYKFSIRQVSWDEARADCQSVEDGDLVIMETEEEFNFIRSRAPESDWWIGLYDKGTEGSFVWVDCQMAAPWARNNWAVGQPNDLSGEQDCVQMLNAGTWNDWECSNPGQYICEVSPKEWSYLDQNPSLLRGEGVNPRTIELQWRPSASNCEVAGYRIYVIVSPEDEAYSIDVADGNTNSALLKNLQPSTVYTFDIAAILASTEILPPVGTLVRIDTPSSDECGNTEFLMSSGYIISPLYPEAYPNNQDCFYTITLPDSTQIIQITVETLDLEQGQDFLTIGSGAVPDENVMATLTGSTVPEGALFTTSHQAWMRFFSDESATSLGFSLAYEALNVESSGELIGSVTIVLVDQSADTLTFEDYDIFKSSVASQLNVYCTQDQANCLADSNGVEFTADDVIITSVSEGSGGMEIIFWVSDPNDPMASQAGLDTDQLQAFLIEYESAIEEDNGPSFDFVVMDPGMTSAIEEPWVIGIIVGLSFCFLLLVIVLVRDCCRTNNKGSTPSVDSVQMVTKISDVDGQNNQISSEFTENVFFQSESAIVEDETRPAAKSTSAAATATAASNEYALPPTVNKDPAPDVATTSFTTSTVETEAIYSVPKRVDSINGQVKAVVEPAAEATEK